MNFSAAPNIVRPPWRDPHPAKVTPIVIGGALDPGTETAYDLGHLDRLAGGIPGELDYTPLDLWSHFAERIGPTFEAVSIWETPDGHCRAG